MSPLKDLYQQLANRGVLRIGAIYIAVSWMIIESGDILLPLFSVSEEHFRWLVITLFAGFPVALILAWVFEVTDKGIVVDDDSSEVVAARPQGRGIDFVVIGVLVVALGFSLFMNFQPGGGMSSSGPAATPDPLPILVADFTNTTGEALFAGALEEALQIGLEGASFVASVSRVDAMRVAQRINPEFDSLDSEVARLVALREGIKLVLSGDALADGSGYVVRVTAIEPVDGKTIVEVEQTADDKLAVLEAIAELSREIREELGDADIDPESVKEVFTAASLEAIHSYLKAQELALRQEFAASVPFYEAAVAEDPMFGRAWSGWALAEFELGRREEAEKLYANALQHLGNMGERERLRTTGHYYAVSSQNFPKAIETYQELVAKYPADTTGLNNLAVASFLNRDFDTAFQAGGRALEIFPNSVLYRANHALYAMYAGQFGEAQERAEALLADQPDYAMGYVVLAAAAFSEGAYQDAAQHYSAMAGTTARGASIGALGQAELALFRGDVSGAIARLQPALEEDARNENVIGIATKRLALANAFLARGDTAQAAAEASAALEASAISRIQFQAGLIFAATGRSDEARALADTLQSKLAKEARAQGAVLLAFLAAEAGENNRAIDLVRQAREHADLWWARYLAGRVYAEMGLHAEALSELEACVARLGEAGAMFLDDLPSWGYAHDLSYWLARSQQGLNMARDAAESYQNYLAQHTEGAASPLLQDAQARLAGLAPP